MTKTYKLAHDIYKTIRTEYCKRILGYGKKTLQDGIKNKKFTPKQEEQIREVFREWIDDIQSRYMECFK